MVYAIDTEGTTAVGGTLRATCVELRECGTAFAHAGGLVRRGVAADHPALPRVVDDFVTTHLAAITAVASACGGLGRSLTWAAQSAHEVELSTAADFGLRGIGATPAGSPTVRP
ncbi:MAG: hypothetical protein L0H79_08240 [Intrasporangium sp.]|uniref:hypothetical protein n=1 Tax=Intrasporangium sp. TaxID=1925024 RepID=UPI002648F8FF|nr:hypothetical protein [Intrasporangium sp.]MDN5795726.1 hypothetical protein [Intrasporangium sp.]